MKKKSTVLMFMLLLLTFAVSGLKAQTDSFLKSTGLPEKREVGLMNMSEPGGLTFGGFSSGFGGGFGQQDGLSFGDFEGESVYETEVPVGQGLLIMTTTSVLYLIAKRRKENK